jgi:hypothetical protein
MRVLVRKSSEGHNNLFEWTVNEHVWYKINLRKIVPVHNGDADPFRALAPFREAIGNMMAYPGFFAATFEGNYDREKKILTVKLSNP